MHWQTLLMPDDETRSVCDALGIAEFVGPRIDDFAVVQTHYGFSTDVEAPCPVLADTLDAIRDRQRHGVNSKQDASNDPGTWDQSRKTQVKQNAICRTCR